MPAAEGVRLFASFSPDVLSGFEVNGAWPRPWGTLPFKSAANLTSLHCLCLGKYDHSMKLVRHYCGEGVNSSYNLIYFPKFILASGNERIQGTIYRLDILNKIRVRNCIVNILNFKFETEKSIHTISCIIVNLKKPGLEDETLGNLSNLTPDR